MPLLFVFYKSVLCVCVFLSFSDGTLGSVFICRMSLNVQSVRHTGKHLIPLAVVLITESCLKVSDLVPTVSYL